MTTTVLLATRNAGKVAELRRILAAYDIDLLGLEDFPDVARGRRRPARPSSTTRC